jgi:hypothetical protein
LTASLLCRSRTTLARRGCFRGPYPMP